VSVPRFHVDPKEATLAPQCELALPTAVARHAVGVLPLRLGDAIVLFDGKGGEYPATLIDAGRTARARTGAHLAIERETGVPLTLVQALVAADVMDAIVQKAVELGAAVIAPVLAERSQRVPADRLQRRSERWQQIAISACEQCGRNRVPRIEPVRTLTDWIAAQPDLRFVAMLYPRAARALGDVATQMRVLLVGPEGGLGEIESALATAAGATPAHLGPRILRADTAAVAGLATLNALADDARPLRAAAANLPRS